MALDSAKGYAVIAEQASNTIQYVDLTSGTPTMNLPPFSVTNPQTGKGIAPTSVAIDDQLAHYGACIVAVASTIWRWSLTMEMPLSR